MTQTMAEKFAETDALIYDFDPKATEDQDGDTSIVTFSDGSRFFTDAASGNTWAA